MKVLRTAMSSSNFSDFAFKRPYSRALLSARPQMVAGESPVAEQYSSSSEMMA